MWSSDGTTAGTHRLTDTQIPNSSNPGSFAAIDNSPPTVANAAVSAITDQQTNHPFQNVVIGDTDLPAQTLTVTVTPDDAAKGQFAAASLTASGFVAGGVNGSYTFTGTAAQATAAIDALVYQPTANRLVVGASETMSFTIAINDGAGGSVVNHQTVITQTSANDAPVGANNSASVNEAATTSTTTRATGVLGNDTDVDSGETATLKVSGAHFGAVADTAVVASGKTTIHGTYGDLHIAADGTYDYTPSTAAAEALPQGQAAAVNVVGAHFGSAVDTAVAATGTTRIHGTYGDLDIQADGTYSYFAATATAEALPQGQTATEVFSYTIADAQGRTSTSTVTITINGANDSPVGTNDGASVNENATASAASRATGVLGNASDVATGETATLKVSGAHFGAVADTAVAASGKTTIHGTYGDLHIAADGTYDYTPNTAAAEALPQGQAASDVFTYTVTDVHGATGTATLTFNITGQEDGPAAVANTVTATEDVAASASTRVSGLLGNDTDVDTGEAATLKVSGAHFGAVADTAVAASGKTTIHGTYGDLLIAADGTYSYTPSTTTAEA